MVPLIEWFDFAIRTFVVVIVPVFVDTKVTSLGRAFEMSIIDKLFVR